MRTLSFILLGFLLVGCVRHIRSYEPKRRNYPTAEYASPNAAQTPGSLWSESAHGLFEDARARRVGDIVTIRVDERSDATRDATTATTRSSEMSMGIPSFFSAMSSLAASNPNLDPSSLLAATSGADFQGGGTTSRSGMVKATLPVRIVHVLPNGDFFVEGSKVLLLNDEESHLYLSGVVRPIDIEPDNSVSSSKLADVELEYTGRGVVSERQSPGWFSRGFDRIRPF